MSVNQALPNRSLSALLREIGTEVVYDLYGTEMSKNELLARHLWQMALTKQTTVITESGEVVTIKASTGEWIDVITRLIERMEGKPLQAIDATIAPGITMTRTPRLLPLDALPNQDEPAELQHPTVEVSNE